MANGKPAMVYFSNVPVHPGRLNLDQLKALQEFKDHCKSQSLYFEFESVEDFRKLLARNLGQRINKELGVVPADRQREISYQPSKEMIEFMMEMIHHDSFQIHRIESDSGTFFRIATRTWPKDVSNYRDRANYEDAFNELVKLGLLTNAGNSRGLFNLTKKGFMHLDQLRHQKGEGDSRKASDN